MVVLLIASGLVLLWAAFVYAPSLLLYRVIFSRRTIEPPTALNLAGTPFAPHADEILDAKAFLAAHLPERVTVTAADGAVLAGDLYRRGEGKTVILFHGYNTHPQKDVGMHAMLFYGRGYDVLVVYERAHGESGGAHVGLGLLERFDVPLWVAKAREESPGCRIVLYGMSMGASSVAYASASLSQNDVSAAVIDCGFTSPYEQLAHDARKRKLPARLLMPLMSLHARVFLRLELRESTSDALAKTEIPAFFLHGEGDMTVPVGCGIKNYEACASEKEALFVPGAAHTAALIDGGEDARKRLLAFIEKHTADKEADK